MTLEKIMNRNVLSIEPTASISDAAKMMQRNNVGSLLVMHNDKLRGIITDRDIVLFLAKSVSINSTIERAMSKNVRTLPLTASIEDLVDTMGYMQIRRVPIVDNDRIVGIITLKDLMRSGYKKYTTNVFEEIFYDYSNHDKLLPSYEETDIHAET